MIYRKKTSDYHHKKRIRKMRLCIKKRKQFLARFAKISGRCKDNTSTSDCGPPPLVKGYRFKFINKKYERVLKTPNSFTKFHAEGSGFYTEWYLYTNKQGRSFEISKTLCPSPITQNKHSNNQYYYDCNQVL